MKHILITGQNSYVGNSLEQWLMQYPDDYTIDKISMRDKNWMEQDFSKYDSIVHVAGIAHRKETKDNASLYYKVNRDLAIEIAEKAKRDGVHQFIFLSSMSVYGLQEGIIDEHTPLNPTNHYGKSKLQAEEKIRALAEDNYKIAIVRPPMIYGKGCKGNYQRLSKLAKKIPVFPKIDNKRSMIYIDNLSKFIRSLMEQSKEGTFCPQNNEYVNTSELVRLIAYQHGKQMKLTKVFNPITKCINNRMYKKIFGDLVYAQSLMHFKELYFIDFKTSIKSTEE